MAVAVRLFLENGYAATTMSAIAAQLGGSKGTLWRHFPSKEALFAACLDDATTAYRNQLAEIFAPDVGLEPTLRALGMSLLAKTTGAGSIALYRLVVSEAGRHPELGAIFYQYAPGETRRQTTAYLQRAMDRGELRQADPQQAARTFTNLVLGGCHLKLVWGQMDAAAPAAMEADVDHALDCFLRIYAPDPR